MQPSPSSDQNTEPPAFYVHDGLDRRDLKIATEDGQERVREYSYIGTSEALSRELRRDGKVATYDYSSSGERMGQRMLDGADDDYHAYAKDANGSVEAVEEEDGSVTADSEYNYDPYGELDDPDPDDAQEPEDALSEDAKQNPFRFEGFYYDSAVKTYDMQAREYLPEAGRFLSADRFEAAGMDLALQSDPLTQNRYAFAGGNPVSVIEWDGHIGWEMAAVYDSQKGGPRARRRAQRRYYRRTYGENSRYAQSAERRDQQDAADAASSSPDAVVAEAKEVRERLVKHESNPSLNPDLRQFQHMSLPQLKQTEEEFGQLPAIHGPYDPISLGTVGNILEWTPYVGSAISVGKAFKNVAEGDFEAAGLNLVDAAGGKYVRGATNAATAVSRAVRGTGDDVAAGTARVGDTLPRPVVGDPKLGNYVDDLYKGTTNPNRIGTGTTADAVRREIATGQATAGTFHIQKAQDTLRGLSNWLGSPPTTSPHDLRVAQSLHDDLVDALGPHR